MRESTTLMGNVGKRHLDINRLPAGYFNVCHFRVSVERTLQTMRAWVNRDRKVAPALHASNARAVQDDAGFIARRVGPSE